MANHVYFKTFQPKKKVFERWQYVSVVNKASDRCKTYFFYHIATCSYLSKVKHLGVTVNHSGDSDLCAELRAQCMVATNYDSISLMRPMHQRVLVQKRLTRMIDYMDKLSTGWKLCCLNYFRISLYWPHVINSIDHPHFHNF